MPIIGLTDRVAEWPTIGTLRKGEPQRDGKNAKGEAIKIVGRDLDYFRFDAIDQSTAAAFAALYGPTPREITIALPYRTMDENFMAFQEAYTAAGLSHRCDGQECYSHNRNGILVPNGTPCPDRNKPDSDRNRCKQVGRLKTIIKGFERTALVTVETHSINDIVAITQHLGAIEALGVGLWGIPMTLRRVEKDIYMPMKGGGRTRVKKWMLQIEISPEWASLQLQSMQRKSLQMMGASLPAPMIELRSRQLNHDVIIVDETTGEIIEEDYEAADLAERMLIDDAERAAYATIEARQPRAETHVCDKCGGAFVWAKNAEGRNDRYNVGADNVRLDELHYKTCGKTAAPVTRSRPCKKCNAPIIFDTLNGKPHPYDANEDGSNSGVSHFDTCPNAQEFRDAQKAQTTTTVHMTKPVTMESIEQTTALIEHIKEMRVLLGGYPDSPSRPLVSYSKADLLALEKELQAQLDQEN